MYLVCLISQILTFSLSTAVHNNSVIFLCQHNRSTLPSCSLNASNFDWKCQKESIINMATICLSWQLQYTYIPKNWLNANKRYGLIARQETRYITPQFRRESFGFLRSLMPSKDFLILFRTEIWMWETAAHQN